MAFSASRRSSETGRSATRFGERVRSPRSPEGSPILLVLSGASKGLSSASRTPRRPSDGASFPRVGRLDAEDGTALRRSTRHEICIRLLLFWFGQVACLRALHREVWIS